MLLGSPRRFVFFFFLLLLLSAFPPACLLLLLASIAFIHGRSREDGKQLPPHRAGVPGAKNRSEEVAERQEKVVERKDLAPPVSAELFLLSTPSPSCYG